MNKENNLPVIRFAGFTDAWEQRKVGDLIDEYTEVTTFNNQYPALTSSRKGIFLQTEYFSGHQVASENNTGYNVVPRGYFTYRHMSDDEIFYFNINDIVDNGIVSTLYPVFKTKDNIADSYFLRYILNYGHEFSKYAVLQKQGGSRTYMYLNKLKNLMLTIPKTYNEQQIISEYFRNLDNLITLHQRKCDSLKKTKKAMLQKMFPKNGESVPEIRFKGFTDAWEQRELGKAFTIRNEKNGDRYTREDVLAVSDTYGCVNQIEFHGRSFAGEDISNYKVVQTGDIVYTKSPLQAKPYGIIKIVGEETGIISPLYVVNETANGIDPMFMYYLFDTPERTNNYLSPLVRKGAKNTMNISNEEWLSGIVTISQSEQEQKTIGSYFKSLDNLIALHQRKLETLKKLKKSMLQKMFV